MSRYIGYEKVPLLNVRPRNAPGPSRTTSCSGDFTGSMRSSTWSVSEKIAVLAPMPSASVRTTTMVKAGRLEQRAEGVAEIAHGAGYHEGLRRATVAQYNSSASRGWQPRDRLVHSLCMDTLTKRSAEELATADRVSWHAVLDPRRDVGRPLRVRGDLDRRSTAGRPARAGSRGAIECVSSTRPTLPARPVSAPASAASPTRPLRG